MKKLLFLYIIFFQTFLYACATCQLMIPTADVSLDLKIDNKKLTNIHVEWKFSDIYSDEILKQYDKNQNDVLDKKELNSILQAKLDYLIPKDMLTELEYAKYDDLGSTDLVVEYKNFDLKMTGGFLVFSYDSIVDLYIEDKLSLSFLFEDDEAYFSFIVSSITSNKSEVHYEENLYLFSASIFFSYVSFDSLKENAQQNKEKEKNKEEKKQRTIDVIKEKTKAKVDEIKKQKIVEDENLQVNLLKSTISEVKSLFESIKDEKNPLSYLLLLFFAYVYGLIHALGPGHGKTLVGSYFLSNERSYSKALFISLAIGLVHTFSAFLLTLIIYFIVDTFLAQFIDESILYTTKISALMIIAIALYLIYKKYKAYQAISDLSVYELGSQIHAQTCACNSCKVENDSTDAALIISAGVIPCPGTVTIFIFSLSLGLYYAGFLAALVMSLGMSTVIFVSALLSVAIRKKTSNSNSNIKKYLEYVSLFIILVLGLFLLIA